jgi:probable HAF family extracellular repeat protein
MMSFRMWSLAGLIALAVGMAVSPARAGDITIIGTPSADGFHFTNFDGPVPGAMGTTINGISNNGTVVGFTTNDGVNFSNFTATPPALPATTVNVAGSTTAMANGINSGGTIVGANNGSAFSLTGNSLVSFIPNGGTSAMAFGINDKGMIVGQYTNATASPGFILNGLNVTTINAPSGPNTVNAQGINNNGLVVGFFQGTDGNAHGFDFKASSAVNGVGTGIAIPDPVITPVEPGATFVFSQILGVNDHDIAVGYYGDSTGSQHGFLLNLNTDKYTFVDNPSAAFDNGVEVTQITGITNSGEITGFYTDSGGIAHGFVASVPEPTSVALLGIGAVGAVGYVGFRKRRAASVARA